MKPGARSEVWTEFDRNPAVAIARARRYIGTDQAWIGECLGPSEETWGPEDGVYNYKHDLVRGAHAKYGPNATVPLPTNARLVFFTGPVDPSQRETQEQSPWVLDHWRSD
jgi:hypothetical protein